MTGIVGTAPHEFAANFLFADDGLRPYFATDNAVKRGEGTRHSRFEVDGETWEVTLYYQNSGILHPGNVTPAGTPFDLGEIREFRVKVIRAGEEDIVGQQSFNAHLAPRWDGMEAETSNGHCNRIPVPEGIEEAVNIRINGSNIEFGRYEKLLRQAFNAVGVSSTYFDNPHPYSNVQDAERYVRIHTDRSGPVHAREGPIAQMGHLLEDDRSGYRKVVQNDDTERNENLPGYYHTVTLGPKRVAEAFPNHDLPKEVKHYYAREALSKSKDDPLRHPKLGASYQVNRWGGKLGVADDDIEKLNQELDQTILSVIANAGLQVHPGNDGPYIEDAYFRAEEVEYKTNPIIKLELTRIQQRQESVVIKHLTDGLSPVEWESLETLVIDGGKISPDEIARRNDRHPDSVRRALRRIEDLVEHEYGKVSLRSPNVADLVHDAVKQAESAVKRSIETAAKALEAAERGLDDGVSALVAWASKHGVDLRDDSEGYVELELGEIEGETADDVHRKIRKLLRDGKHIWERAGRDPRFYEGGTWRAKAIYTERRESYLQVGSENSYLTKERRKPMSGFVGRKTG